MEAACLLNQVTAQGFSHLLDFRPAPNVEATAVAQPA